MCIRDSYHTGGSGAPGLGALMFDYPTLLERPLPAALQTGVFLLLFVGFAVKTPLFPFHTWLPTVLREGPVGLSALLVGLKLGAFGILRFAVPLAPTAARDFVWLMAGLGLFGMVSVSYTHLDVYKRQVTPVFQLVWTTSRRSQLISS